MDLLKNRSIFLLEDLDMSKNDDNKRCSISVSLTPKERDELKEIAKKYGLSLSAFLRLAAAKYVENEKKN